MAAAGEIPWLKKHCSPAGFLASDHSVKHNSQALPSTAYSVWRFTASLSCLNLIFSRQPNFLATTLRVVENIKKPINRKEGDAKSHLTSHSSKSGKIIASHDSTKTSEEEISDKLTPK